MPQSLACIYLHLVFSTKNREPWISHDWADRLYGYVGGTVRGDGHTLLAAGGMPDHVHFLISLGRVQGVAAMVGRLKSSSSRWVHDSFPNRSGFSWQAGYGVFSVSESQLDVVTKYVLNQAEHHRARTFQEEYRRLLRKHRKEFDERYVWD